MLKIVRIAPFVFAAVVCFVAVVRFNAGPAWVLRALGMAALPVPLAFFAAFLIPDRVPPPGEPSSDEKAPSLALFGVGALLTLGLLGHLAQQIDINVARSPSAPLLVSTLACVDFLNGMRLKYRGVAALMTGIGLGLGTFLFIQLL